MAGSLTRVKKFQRPRGAGKLLSPGSVESWHEIQTRAACNVLVRLHNREVAEGNTGHAAVLFEALRLVADALDRGEPERYAS